MGLEGLGRFFCCKALQGADYCEDPSSLFGGSGSFRRSLKPQKGNKRGAIPDQGLSFTLGGLFLEAEVPPSLRGWSNQKFKNFRSTHQLWSSL